MCGIVGKADPLLAAAPMKAALERMADCIVHRGPDDSGIVSDSGVGIGMRRLSIIDVAGGQQPIANETEDVFVVCNGEIYNHQLLRHNLAARGHQFRTHSDAEVIVHLYEEYGAECFGFLRGMFGLAIWDAREQSLWIARDRLGKKPLFYAQQEEQFSFASEMKSLLADSPRLRTPSYRNLGAFFQSAYIPQPETIYEGINRLPAGHFGVWRKGTFQHQPFWELSFESDESLTESQWIERLDAKLSEAVQIRLESEVPLGVFLSGGLDSSAIVAYAHAAGLRPLKTFTVGFDRSEWDESSDAQRIASHFDTEHHLLHLSESTLSSSFVDTLNAIVRHCDEPFGDASAIPTYHISRLAREHVTVILSGDGGDELFAGYSSYRGALFAQAYRRWTPGGIGRNLMPTAFRQAADMLSGSAKFKIQRIAKVLQDSALPLRDAYRNKTSIWNRQQLQDLFTPELFEEANYLEEQYLPPDLWSVLTDTKRDLVSRLTEIDIRSYMLDDILVKVDRMSMAHSLEVRSPLLDHEIVELAARMPSRFKLNGWFGNSGKSILRKTLRNKLPPKSLGKGKQGFGVPLRDWFRGSLRDYVRDMLLGSDNLPNELFQRSVVENVVDEHERGSVDHANRIWLLLTFAAWHEQYQSSTTVAENRSAMAESAP